RSTDSAIFLCNNLKIVELEEQHHIILLCLVRQPSESSPDRSSHLSEPSKILGIIASLNARRTYGFRDRFLTLISWATVPAPARLRLLQTVPSSRLRK